METILPGLVTQLIGKLFTNGPQDVVVAILLLGAGVLVFALRKAQKERDTAYERLEELQKYAMSVVTQNSKELADLLVKISDKHADSQEKVATALSTVNDSVKAVVIDLERRLWTQRVDR